MAQLRIPLDEKRFNSGQAWKDYMAQMGDTRARTEENYSKASLTDEERKFFSGLTQVKYVLMLGENWCGDVHRNSPMIARIVEAMPGTELRVFFRDQNADLTDCFLNNGYRSIPIVAFFDKDWNEIGRWIERPGAATQKMYAIRATTVDLAGALGRLRSERGVRSVLCEGGPSLNGALVEDGLLDELFLTTGPVLAGGEAPAIATASCRARWPIPAPLLVTRRIEPRELIRRRSGGSARPPSAEGPGSPRRTR